MINMISYKSQHPILSTVHICNVSTQGFQDMGGSMSQVVGLPFKSYKPITNTAWVRTQLCKLQKGCTRLAAPSDKVYQLFAHGRWFSPGTPASSTTKTGRHDIAEILLKVALSTINQNQKSIKSYSISLKLHGAIPRILIRIN